MEWLTATRATGTLAYGVAFACCGLAWAKAKAGTALSRLAAFLTIAEGALLLDMIFNLRWVLHRSLMDEAMRLHAYGSRRAPQELVLIVLGGLLVLSFPWVLRRFRAEGGSRLALLGLLLSLVLWCSEVISLHAVDSVLQHPIGRWMAVSLFWVLACLMTSLGILLELGRPKQRA